MVLLYCQSIVYYNQMLLVWLVLICFCFQICSRLKISCSQTFTPTQGKSDWNSFIWSSRYLYCSITNGSIADYSDSNNIWKLFLILIISLQVPYFLIRFKEMLMLPCFCLIWLNLVMASSKLILITAGYFILVSMVIWFESRYKASWFIS